MRCEGSNRSAIPRTDEFNHVRSPTAGRDDAIVSGDPWSAALSGTSHAAAAADRRHSLGSRHQFIKCVAKRHDVSEFRQRFMNAAGMKQISQQTAEELFHELYGGHNISGREIRIGGSNKNDRREKM